MSTIRVVIAKPGLDGHDRGAKIIARALRDAGMEVIYTGLHQTPEQIVETAIQEDADAIGISILSGAHMTLVPRILDLLAAREADDVLVVLGGTIPADDIEELKGRGVAEVFTPGAPTGAIVEFLRSRLGRADSDVKIAVCVKAVPDAATGRRLDPATRRLDRSGELALSDFDANPLEEALRIREAAGEGEVVVVSLGPERAADALRKALAIGADRSVLVADDAFAGADLLVTARALAGALEREAADLVLFGQQSADGDGACLWAAVAELLRRPAISQVAELTVEDGAVTGRRQTEVGYERVRAPLPAVVAVTESINEPRYPSLKGIMGAKSKPQERLSAADVGGAAEAQTTVLGVAPPPPHGETRRIEGGAETAAAIVDFLAEKRLL